MMKVLITEVTQDRLILLGSICIYTATYVATDIDCSFVVTAIAI